MEKISCETCRYFDLGCKNSKLTRGQKRKRYRLGDCQFWETATPIESEGERRQAHGQSQTIEQALTEIARQLSEIADILKKDQL